MPIAKCKDGKRHRWKNGRCTVCRKTERGLHDDWLEQTYVRIIVESQKPAVKLMQYECTCCKLHGPGPTYGGINR